MFFLDSSRSHSCGDRSSRNEKYAMAAISDTAPQKTTPTIIQRPRCDRAGVSADSAIGQLGMNTGHKCPQDNAAIVTFCRHLFQLAGHEASQTSGLPVPATRRFVL